MSARGIAWQARGSRPPPFDSSGSPRRFGHSSCALFAHPDLGKAVLPAVGWALTREPWFAFAAPVADPMASPAAVVLVAAGACAFAAVGAQKWPRWPGERRVTREDPK